MFGVTQAVTSTLQQCLLEIEFASPLEQKIKGDRAKDITKTKASIKVVVALGMT